MMDKPPSPSDLWQHPSVRVSAAVAVAGLYALLCYALVESVLGGLGLISVVFAILQPAIISAFVAYIGDPMYRRTRSYYLLVPTALTVGMIVVAAFFLQEGVICIAMLSPLWLVSGTTGTYILTKVRKRPQSRDEDVAVFQASAWLLVPLIMIPVEQSIPLPTAEYTVTRSIDVDAKPENVWELMQSVPDLSPEEGRWNLSQDVIGVPRPVEASLEGQGVDSVRRAQWGEGIMFEEHVTTWSPEKEIAWDFVFPQSDAWDFTDRHLHPDSDYMRIETGGYTLEQLGPERVRLTLHTTYKARTALNAYASLWGEFFLGDIQSNILAAIADRAEAQ
ncbi:hypothetical protein [Erythrobacter sp. Alg231-14]|uniref:hypothetical protein n=1 Tax=Erythrobacter sp. Alg231-14 TaxID=1922225 RepID=UPI000D54FF26